MKLGELIRSFRHPFREIPTPETYMNREQRWQLNADHIIANLESDRIGELEPLRVDWIKKRDRRIKSLELLIAKARRHGVELQAPPDTAACYTVPLLNGR